MNRCLLPILSILLLASCNQETKKDKHLMFEANDTIYRYNEKNNTLKPRYIMHCGKRPDAESIYKIGKNSDYFKYIFAFDLLETKDYLYIDVEKD